VGLTYIDGVVSGPSGQRRVTFLIDTGATFTVVPSEVWHAIGLSPQRTKGFHLADGTRIERALSECVIELPEIEGEVPRGTSPVILGEKGDVALLGAVTFEVLMLVFNPFDRSLRVMTEAPLMGLSA
jgi:predicted aspartyl protease